MRLVDSSDEGGFHSPFIWSPYFLCGFLMFIFSIAKVRKRTEAHPPIEEKCSGSFRGVEVPVCVSLCRLAPLVSRAKKEDLAAYFVTPPLCASAMLPDFLFSSFFCPRPLCKRSQELHRNVRQPQWFLYRLGIATDLNYSESATLFICVLSLAEW